LENGLTLEWWQIFDASYVIGLVIAAAVAGSANGLDVVFLAQISDVRILLELWFARSSFDGRLAGSAQRVSRVRR